MADYKLSEAAKKDLLMVAQYGDDQFGFVKSNQYRDQLKQRFSILARQPMLYPAVNHIRTGYRRSVCGVHSVYYRIDKGIVEIMRVIGRQDTDFNV